MKKVAKLVMIDRDEQYLMMWRSDHPTLGEDPDLPGGTHEDGEELIDTMLREVDEEAGVTIKREDVVEVYGGVAYSEHDTFYGLYVARFDHRPEIIMSWEHSSYEWISRDAFIRTAAAAKDTYMHMVADVIAKYKD